MAHSLSSAAQRWRSLIDTFIQDRCAAKLDKLSPDDSKYQTIVEQYQRDTWIEDAARRVSQLQVVTHTLKGIHPSARGTSLFVPPEQMADTHHVGSASCKCIMNQDVVGGASALDVYKLLSLRNEAHTLLEGLQRRDPDVLAALSDDASQAARWAEAFARITEPKGELASHVNAKQLYWLTGDDPCDDRHFVLLAPLFPSSLVHDVHALIQQDRFGEAAKAARKARREKTASEDEVRHYPQLAIRKLGGTKPQNISQLNSERGGQNLLLVSLPPKWTLNDVRPIMGTSAYPSLRRYPTYAAPAGRLRRFIRSMNVARKKHDDQQDRSPLTEKEWYDQYANERTRRKVKRLIQQMFDGVVDFTLAMHRLPPGWTMGRKAEEGQAALTCRLPACAQHWLDPHRATSDSDFRLARADGRWRAELKRDLAEEVNILLNAGLQGTKVKVGEVEHSEWARRADGHVKLKQLFEVDEAFMDELFSDALGIFGADEEPA